MKKVLIILLCVCSLNANATEMCARDDTVVVPLDATVNVGEELYYNYIEWLYGRETPYGSIHTAITLLSIADIQEIENNTNIASAPDVLSVSDERILGRDGCYNDDCTDANNERIYCYYQMTHPMLSRWVLQGKHTGVTNCINNVRWYALGLDGRKKLFNAIK